MHPSEVAGTMETEALRVKGEESMSEKSNHFHVINSLDDILDEQNSADQAHDHAEEELRVK
jgi:hypothetical protein